MFFNMNLFSSFDLNTFMFNFYIFFFFFLVNFMKVLKWNSNLLYFYMFLNLFLEMILASLKPDYKKNFFKMMNFKMFLSVFYFIYFMNIFSLSIFSFSFTSMFSFNFSLVSALWLGSILKNIKKMNSFFEHLCPLGCPLALSFFMVLIETVSMIIQPIAMILRLTINMISGHIMISIFSMVMIQSFMNLFLISFIFFPFLIMKFFICGIQSYIISILISMCYNQ